VAEFEELLAAHPNAIAAMISAPTIPNAT